MISKVNDSRCIRSASFVACLLAHVDANTTIQRRRENINALEHKLQSVPNGSGARGQLPVRYAQDFTTCMKLTP